MQFKKIAFFTILSLLVFTGCGSEDSQNNQTKSKKNTNEYQLTTNKVQTLHLKVGEESLLFEEFKGKAVLVNFFATWCPPCKAEIPHLNNLKTKYADQFEIVAVLLEDGKSTAEIEEFREQFKINYVITNSNENFELANALGGVKSIPTMFLYDKEGKLVQKYVGIVPEEMLATDIKKAIK